MQEEHGELGEEMEEEEEMRVTRTSARLGRSQEKSEQGAEERAADDEIMILERNEAFAEEEESKYVEACKRKKCIVRIVRIQETEKSGHFVLRSNSAEDLVKELLNHILKNVVDEHMLKACLVI